MGEIRTSRRCAELESNFRPDGPMRAVRTLSYRTDAETRFLPQCPLIQIKATRAKALSFVFGSERSGREGKNKLSRAALTEPSAGAPVRPPSSFPQSPKSKSPQ
jgi:hypothetical protein